MTKTIPTRHQHPIAMLRYTARYLFLLLFPLARGLRYIRSPRGLYEWMRGTWQDLLVVLALLLLSYLSWQMHTYSLDAKGFCIRRGILFHRRSLIPRRSIVTLSVEHPFYLRPLRAVRISIDTDASGSYQADFSFIIGESRAREILEQRLEKAIQPQYAYTPRWYHAVLMSLLLSNSFSGIFLLATTLHQTGQLLGEGVRDQLLGDFEAVAGYIRLIPRTAALIALVLLSGWCVAAGRNILRYLPFRATRYPQFLTVRTGLFTRRDYSCAVACVNYIDLRQSIVSRLLRLETVFVHCIGYGKGENAMSVLIPASRRSHARQEAARLLPEFPLQRVTLRTAPLSAYRYVFYPLWAMLLLSPVSRFLQSWLPQWQELIFYLTAMAYIPCLWELLVKLIDRYTAGLARENGFLCLRYSRWYTFHTVIVPEERVVVYRLTQTPFQRLGRNCDVLIGTYNEKSHNHRIRNLPLQQAEELLAGLSCADHPTE